MVAKIRMLDLSMGGATDLEFEKYCKVGESPRTVLPASRHYSKAEHWTRREKPRLKGDQHSIEQGFKEIQFRNYRSHSCKTLPSKNLHVVDSKLLKRGSVYQSSQNRIPKRPDICEGRKKIECSLVDDASFSFSLLDSICGSDEEGELPLEINRSPVKTPVSNRVTFAEAPKEPRFLESDIRESTCSSSKPAERDLMENFKFKSHQVAGPANSANILEEKDKHALKKSASAKVAFPQSPTSSYSDCSKGSPNSRFTPIKKMFEPLTKSESHRRLVKSKSESNETKPPRLSSIGRIQTIRKSLLPDFMRTTAPPKVESDGNLSLKKGSHEESTPPCFPAHLQGNLKVKEKHGTPYFELSLFHTEDVFVAKSWKVEDSLSYVYTFHSIKGRKNSGAGGKKGLKYSIKDLPIVGQMQVSCHLRWEIKDLKGAFSNSIETEFVLYDILNAKKSYASEESSVPDVTEILSQSNEGSDVSTHGLDDNVDSSKVKAQTNMSACGRGSSLDFSNPYPWTPADLHPCIETAAIVITVPVEKRESLKYRSGDTIGQPDHLNLLGKSLGEKTLKSSITNNMTRVHVVTPMGHHSLPTSSSENHRPSSLLDRWRSGGGCDCGGWDMGCPLIIFSNQTAEGGELHSLLESYRSFEIFVQGSKERIPALTIRYTRKGQYTIDFHAQLTSLQAFAVCVAILHATTEVPTLVDREMNEQLLECSSIKVAVQDEVKRLIEAVTDEEKAMKDKVRAATEIGQQPAPYVLNPPISPIARV